MFYFSLLCKLGWKSPTYATPIDFIKKSKSGTDTGGGDTGSGDTGGGDTGGGDTGGGDTGGGDTGGGDTGGGDTGGDNVQRCLSITTIIFKSY